MDLINFLYYNPSGEHSKSNDAVYTDLITFICSDICNILSFLKVVVEDVI